jgi:chloride channel 7
LLFFTILMLTGACFGRLVGHLLHAFDQRRGTFADSGTFALIGAAAGLGGMARMTISLVVILLEATGDIQYLVPLMLTVMLARWVGNCFNEGLYDMHIHLKKIPFLEENDAESGIVDISLGDVMTRAPICFPPLVSVYEVFDLLQRNNHHAFPVVGKAYAKSGMNTGPDVLLGMVPRKVICVLLKHRAIGFYDEKPEIGIDTPPLSPLVNWGALEREYPNYPDVDDITLCANDASGWLDLRPYIDRGPFTLNEKSSVQRAYKLFRTLGLRHLIVTNDSNQVVGIVTRKELLPSHISKFDRFYVGEYLSLDGSEAPLTSDGKNSPSSRNITLDSLNL